MYTVLHNNVDANQLTVLVLVVTIAGGLGVGSAHIGATWVESGGAHNYALH